MLFRLNNNFLHLLLLLTYNVIAIILTSPGVIGLRCAGLSGMTTVTFWLSVSVSIVLIRGVGLALVAVGFAGVVVGLGLNFFAHSSHSFDSRFTACSAHSAPCLRRSCAAFRLCSTSSSFLNIFLSSSICLASSSIFARCISRFLYWTFAASIPLLVPFFVVFSSLLLFLFLALLPLLVLHV